MKITHALAFSAFFAAGSAAYAQTTPPTGRTFGDGTLPEFLQPYDVDGDGKLNAEEREAARNARDERRQEALDRWDTNNDGKLSQAELDAAREANRARIDAIRAQRFDEANTDTTGDTATESYLSPEEFAAMCEHATLPAEMVTRIFNMLDADKDGFISKTEFLRSCQPPPPPPQIPLFATADADSNSEVSLDEFVAACATVQIPALQAREIFARHDRNQDHKLVVGEYPGTQTPPPPPRPRSCPPLPWRMPIQSTDS